MRVLFYSFSGHQNHDVNKNDKERYVHQHIICDNMSQKRDM